MIRNPVPWPNGARCAACLTFDMDADSLIHIAHPDDGYRRVSGISMLQYGPTVAVPRIVETYRQLGIRQTFFIPAWCIERYPDAIEIILAGGHEIGHHGFLHEHPNELPPEEEARWLDRGIDVIVKATGQKPRGWRAPLYNMSDVSVPLLVERGFTYDASLMGDDIPYVLDAANGSLIEIPSYWGLDDWPQYVQSFDLDYMMPIRAPRAGFEAFRQEYEVAKKYGGLWVPVVHPFASGRLSRWEVYAEFLGAEVAAGQTWFAPMEEIAAYVKALIDTGKYVPRRVPMPLYGGPVRI